MCPHGKERGGDGDREEEHEEGGGGEGVFAGEEDRDRHHRTEFAQRTDGEDVTAEPGLEDTGVVQHGQDGAESGGGESHPDHDRVQGEPGRHQAERDNQREYQGEQPSRRGPTKGVTVDACQVDLVSGQEHEEPKTQI